MWIVFAGCISSIIHDHIFAWEIFVDDGSCERGGGRVKMIIEYATDSPATFSDWVRMSQSNFFGRMIVGSWTRFGPSERS